MQDGADYFGWLSEEFLGVNMIHTDYSKIAHKYDNGKDRKHFEKDKHIHGLIESMPDNIKVLDLSCGTGNYLKKQIESFPDSNIEWFGVDYSVDMLNVAKGKLPNIELIKAPAEEIPFKDNYFHYIHCSNAFHHYYNKEKAISEMNRVLKQKGIIEISSIAPEFMHYSWVYTFFPESLMIDKKRFWSHEMIFNELESHGFIVQANVTYSYSRERLTDILSMAQNRDASQLNLISEQCYNEGMKIIQDKLEQNIGATFLRSFAIMRIVASR